MIQEVKVRFPSAGPSLAVLLSDGFFPLSPQESLKDPSLPFGVDLLIPQIGGSARKTNVCWIPSPNPS